ncbi:AlpA family phage regulatory protein [Vibrio parahaemolyticus]|nr:AlpA family phage regulatory protein [Vibrio parahaemolyticus]EHU5162058.1 AlpA family phage regulatory protein [Vibrio parahaemolyticus]
MALIHPINQLKIEKKADVLKRVGLSQATLHRRINDGTFPPAVQLGPKAVGFMSHEVDAFLIACAIGEDKKRVVAELLAQRQTPKQANPLLQYMNFQ